VQYDVVSGCFFLFLVLVLPMGLGILVAVPTSPMVNIFINSWPDIVIFVLGCFTAISEAAADT